MKILKAIFIAALLTRAASAQRVISGVDADRNATRLTHDIHWNTSLDQAQQQARKEGKLIFWMHMLGKIDGTT